jgi:hypothetical protein
MESAYNAVIVDLSEYITQGRDRLTRSVQQYDTGKTKYYLQKEANLLQQKFKTQDSAAQNIKYQLQSSTETQKIEELKRKPMHAGTLKDHQLIEKNSWRGYVAEARREKRRA